MTDYRQPAHEDVTKVVCDSCRRRERHTYSHDQVTCPFCGSPARAAEEYDCKFNVKSKHVIMTYCTGVTGMSFFARITRDEKCGLDVGPHVHLSCSRCGGTWACRPIVDP